MSDKRILYTWEGYPAGEKMRTLMGPDPIPCFIMAADTPTAWMAARQYAMPETDLAAQEILRLVAENAALRKQIADLEDDRAKRRARFQR